MTTPIVESVRFNVSPQELFRIYTDPRKHSAATGAKATVTAKAGRPFRAFDGMLSGRNLLVVPLA